VQAAIRCAEQQEYFCRADAEAAAVQLRAVHTAYHHVEATVEERPVYGRGRPSPQEPRPIKAMRSRLKTAISPQTEHIARLEAEAGCFVLLTNVPTAGDLAHSARDLLTVYKDQHGTEQNYGFLKDPVIVNRLFLKKEERIEALGLVLLLALLIWRLMERAMRRYVDTTRTPLPGWDKKATERPTAFMMITKFAGVIVMKLGLHRHLARPLSGVQQQDLTALDVPATCFTFPSGEQRTAMAGQRL
jgi:transposase